MILESMARPALPHRRAAIEMSLNIQTIVLDFPPPSLILPYINRQVGNLVDCRARANSKAERATETDRLMLQPV